MSMDTALTGLLAAAMASGVALKGLPSIACTIPARWAELAAVLDFAHVALR